MLFGAEVFVSPQVLSMCLTELVKKLSSVNNGRGLISNTTFCVGVPGMIRILLRLFILYKK